MKLLSSLLDEVTASKYLKFLLYIAHIYKRSNDPSARSIEILGLIYCRRPKTLMYYFMRPFELLVLLNFFDDNVLALINPTTKDR